MLQVDNVVNSWREAFQRINEGIYDFQVIKPQVDEWMEQTIMIPESTSVRPGPYSFDFTPYMREIVNCIHPSSVWRFISIMKDGQSGFTTALVVGGICYIISETPEGILFTASDVLLASKTIEERLDPVIRSSNIQDLIRPNVIKKTNNRTGDTSKKKEFAGGTLTSAGTGNPNTFRMFSAKFIFADDYDTAPKEIGKEGSPKMVMKTRQNSFGNKAKTFMISTPTVTQTSNIYEQYLLGTQEKWNWLCPCCDEPFVVEWQTHLEDGTFAGIVWQLDENKKLIPESVKYKCPHCGGLIEEKQKYDLNLAADKSPRAGWIPTCPNPEERNHRSFQKNFIYNPPGFDGWVTGVEEWLAACPPGEKVKIKLLKVFNNLRLGLPFEELGESPKVNDLMQNTRSYHPGIVPDLTCEQDGNGKIVMITLACDLNGVMEKGNEDVRLDWEVLAHTSGGATYSVDHGSIGTFKRTRDKNASDRQNDMNRERWTLHHNISNSVWDPFKDIVLNEYPTESNDTMKITITVVDIGFGKKQAMEFISSMSSEVTIYGVKGRVEENYRKLVKDSNPITRSKELSQYFYIVLVDQLKDELADMMKLREGDDGSQPNGYMNFPESRDGKYNMKNYFSHYEGERRTEVLKNGDVIGYRWEKKNSQAQNHFWDVRIYNLASTMVYLDLLRRSDTRYRSYTWQDFVDEVT